MCRSTESNNHQKLIQRHIWEAYIEEAEHLRHHGEIKQIYAKRKEMIERVLADAKEKHGMRWTTLRGLKNKVYVGDAYFCCELKKDGDLDLANCLSGAKLVDWSGGCLTPGGFAGQVRSRRSDSSEEAHRLPPGKQVPGAEINGFLLPTIQK